MDGYQGLTLVLSLLGGMAALLAGWVAAAWAGRSATLGLERARLDVTLARFLGNLVRWLILLLLLLGVLGAVGIETTSFAAVLGGASLAVGLAFRDSLANFSAGVLLLIFRPFRVGDVVNVGGITGRVHEIELFVTRIDTFDNRRFVLPNNTVFKANIENITHHPRRRVDIDVGVSYLADIDHTRAVLLAALATVPDALEDPPPQVVLQGFAESSVNWTARVWAPSPNFVDVRQGTIRAVKMALDEAGIEIPFPQRVVHMVPGLVVPDAPNDPSSDQVA